MHKIFGLLVALLAFTLSLDAAGDDAKKKRGFGDPEENFKKLDKDSNNKLSKDEYLEISKLAKDADKAAKFKGVLEKVFSKYSSNGEMSLDQFKEARKAMMDRKKDK